MKYFNKFTVAIISGSILVPLAVMAMNSPASKLTIPKKSFGSTPEGKAVDLYTLTNANGLEAQIMTYGCIVVSLKVPDRTGHLDDIVLGYDDLEGYIKDNPYFGSLVGRYGNRIALGRFTLDGKQYKLAINNGVNHLHGGTKGFDKVVWDARQVSGSDGMGLELSYFSKDGEEGYPGNLSVKVIYTLTKKNELKIKYSATTDKDTIVNLTHHSYFNLAGAGSGDILSHKMKINADHFTPVDSTLITTGEIKSVRHTPMDFSKPTAIGQRINQKDDQLIFGKGYDHNWVLNQTRNSINMAAVVSEPKTGRIMEVYTTEPGLQFYSGNFLDGTRTGKNNKVYNFRNGFCLEAQHYPDSPNKPKFPSTVLKPGKEYSQLTIYKFSAK